MAVVVVTTNDHLMTGVVDHLEHMTDGRWHDNCRYCLARRVHGGNGVWFLGTGAQIVVVV